MYIYRETYKNFVKGISLKRFFKKKRFIEGVFRSSFQELLILKDL